MADVAPSSPRTERHARLRALRVRADRVIGISALVGSMLALPLAQNVWHGPEVAATLAVAATAWLAGQRWALSIVLLAQLMLLPTIVPRAALGASMYAQVTGWAALLAMLPGIFAMRRAAASAVLLTGWRRTQWRVRGAGAGLILAGALAAVVPFL